jgi:hypothetical protein
VERLGGPLFGLIEQIADFSQNVRSGDDPGESANDALQQPVILGDESIRPLVPPDELRSDTTYDVKDQEVRIEEQFFASPLRWQWGHRGSFLKELDADDFS